MSIPRTSGAFVAASWSALLIGALSFSIGLFNAEMVLHEKGYYFAVLILGLFSAVSLQKSVRDRLEKIPVTNLYYGICYLALIISFLLLLVGLWNAELLLSEKGFYGISFMLSLFGVVAVQKNTRDLIAYDKSSGPPSL